MCYLNHINHNFPKIPPWLLSSNSNLYELQRISNFEKTSVTALLEVINHTFFKELFFIFVSGGFKYMVSTIYIRAYKSQHTE